MTKWLKLRFHIVQLFLDDISDVNFTHITLSHRISLTETAIIELYQVR